MATPYSQDLRDRVLAAYDRGMETEHIATTFCVSPAWARRVRQRRRDHGETSPRKVGSPGVRKIDRDQLVELVTADPDATLVELRDRLGVPCTSAAISKVLRKLGFTFKKRQSMQRNKTVPTSQSADKNGLLGQPTLIRRGCVAKCE